MTYEAIIKDISAKKYAPLYILHGEEGFFIDKISNQISDTVLDEGEKAFNQMTLYGKEITTTQIVDSARQFPMMAPYRVIIVKEAQAMGKLDALVPYIENPSPQTILVLNHKHKKIDGRSKVLKSAKAKGVVFESKKLYDNQIAPWIISAVDAKGKMINQPAAHMMAEFLGSDLSKVSNEIDKILVNLGAEKTITEDMVREQVGITKDYNVFELQKALSLGDTEKAFRIVKYFGDNPKSNPLVMVLSSLYNYFTKVYSIAYYGNKKQDKELASIVGVSPFFLKEYKQAARNYPMGKLVTIFSALKTADLRSKGVGTRGTSDNEILRELMIKIFY